MRELFRLNCQYCGKEFNDVERFLGHESFCKKKKGSNNVKPKHYKQGKEDLIEMWYRTMTLEQFRGAMKSNIIKYTMRYEGKNGIEDIDKAIEYLNRLKGYEKNELQK
ncbi:hypothetical protein [Enterococcus phage vB_EfaP_Ef6.3]|uniref:Uncharacterized protein n=1 Tax=Enterococcus phage vB_EfaP_Ef6.3 TaxID=2546622 RepID=A0A4D6DUD4_9CAUD|nr:nucleotide kinase [Enterococcus phage vB_EfaP_Ef6.3]QBZ69536.1 hypothetical protein [Enterococcus phage vB_EfaP_Ef6.3]